MNQKNSLNAFTRFLKFFRKSLRTYKLYRFRLKDGVAEIEYTNITNTGCNSKTSEPYLHVLHIHEVSEIEVKPYRGTGLGAVVTRQSQNTKIETLSWSTLRRYVQKAGWLSEVNDYIKSTENLVSADNWQACDCSRSGPDYDVVVYRTVDYGNSNKKEERYHVSMGLLIAWNCRPQAIAELYLKHLDRFEVKQPLIDYILRMEEYNYEDESFEDLKDMSYADLYIQYFNKMKMKTKNK